MIQFVADKVKTGAAAMELAKQTPVLVLFVVLIFGTFYYMERRDTHWMDMLKRGDEVQKMRIEECHRVQGESTEALKAVAEGMQVQASASLAQSLAFREFSIRLEAHEDQR